MLGGLRPASLDRASGAPRGRTAEEKTTMPRNFGDALTESAPAVAIDARTAGAKSRRRVPRWLLVVGFWTLIVLAYSTRTEIRSPSYTWVNISWISSVKLAMAQWYSWGLLSLVIYWVNRRLPFRSDALLVRLLVHVPLSFVFGVAFTYLNVALTELLDAPVENVWVGATVFETATRVVYRLGSFVYWAIVAICVALDYQSDLKDKEIRSAELERLLAEARLATLRTQLDPHFLFNTLNSISAYVESAPREARLMLEQLGDLLRFSLEHANEQEIPLERELAFVDRYVHLQLVRFSDRLDVRTEVEPDAMGAAVPTFLLQPLVENAIRHGVSGLATAGVIDLAAWREEDRLHVEVRDNGPGLPPGWSLESNAGIGLGNTRARLEQLYGKGNYTLDVAANGGGGTRVAITMPCRAA
jgi:two-component system, LytTR family, sensor kinase